MFYLIVSGILAACTHKEGTAYNRYETYIYLLAGGIFEFAVLASHTIACQNASAVFVALLSNQQIAYAYLADVFIFHYIAAGW